MSHGKRIFNKSTSGFTLIELVVVLVIIGMLAAVVITKLDKVPDQADAVINADNINELNKYVQMHSATTGMVPDHLDSLLDDTGSLVNGPWTSNSYLTVDESPSSTTLDAISNLGIENVHDSVGTLTSTTGLESLVKLNETVINATGQDCSIMGQMIPAGTMGSNLYVFGMGRYNESRDPNLRLANVARCPLVKDPTNSTYDHYLLVIQVNDDQAEYLGFVDPYMEECIQEL